MVESSSAYQKHNSDFDFEEEIKDLSENQAECVGESPYRFVWPGEDAYFGVVEIQGK